MPPLSLEDRVAVLEQKIASMEATKPNVAGGKDWRKAVGIFTDNPGMLEILDEAMKLREADRAKARRDTRKTKRASELQKK
jgi:hypothetical protein